MVLYCYHVQSQLFPGVDSIEHDLIRQFNCAVASLLCILGVKKGTRWNANERHCGPVECAVMMMITVLLKAPATVVYKCGEEISLACQIWM